MPFKEMLKPSPISRHTVITNDFSHTLLWRLDTCIQTLWISNFNLLVESLGSHVRIVTYLFRFNVLLNAEYLNKFFSESEPVDPIFDQNFTSSSLWISAWFYRTSQFLLFVKGMKIFTHSLGKILPHTRAQFGRKNLLQFGLGPLRFKANTGCLAILGCFGSPWKQAACFCQHRAPSAKGIFCYVPMTWLQTLYTVWATYAGMKSLNIFKMLLWSSSSSLNSSPLPLSLPSLLWPEDSPRVCWSQAPYFLLSLKYLNQTRHHFIYKLRNSDLCGVSRLLNLKLCCFKSLIGVNTNLILSGCCGPFPTDSHRLHLTLFF